MILSRILYSRNADKVGGDVLLRFGFRRFDACEFEKMGSSAVGAGRLSGVMIFTVVVSGVEIDASVLFSIRRASGGAGAFVVEILGRRSELRRKMTFRRTNIEGSRRDLSLVGKNEKVSIY